MPVTDRTDYIAELIGGTWVVKGPAADGENRPIHYLCPPEAGAPPPESRARRVAELLNEDYDTPLYVGPG